MPPTERAPRPGTQLAQLRLQRALLEPKVLSDDALEAQVDASAELARAQNEGRKDDLIQLDEQIAKIQTNPEE